MRCEISEVPRQILIEACFLIYKNISIMLIIISNN